MKIRLLILPVLFISIFTISAQTYQLTVDSVEYTPLENSISLNDGQVWDNDLYTVPLGFDFDFFDTPLSTLFIGSNGEVSDQDLYYGNLNSSLFPYLADLIDRGEGSNSLSNISYVIEGGEGDLIFKLEWNNAGFAEDSFDGGQSFVNFQVWLYERDQSIEFYYGDNFLLDEDLLYGYGGGPLIALIDKSNSDFGTTDEFIALIGDPSNPSIRLILENLNDYEYFDFLENAPPANIRYRFTRASVSTDEITTRSEQFSIHPNPASTVLNLVNNAEAEIQDILIYGNDGRLVKIIAADYSNIDVADLVNGVYHLHILTTDGLAVKRFVKLDQ